MCKGAYNKAQNVILMVRAQDGERRLIMMVDPKGRQGTIGREVQEEAEEQGTSRCKGNGREATAGMGVQYPLPQVNVSQRAVLKVR